MIAKQIYLLLSFAALSSETPSFAGEVAERLRAPVAFDFSSAKAADSLEYCVADAISSLAPVASLRDGANRVIVTASASAGNVLVAIELNRASNGTRVVGHVYGPRWSERLRQAVFACK